MDEYDFQGLSFQQDNETPHFANVTMEILGEKFEESAISRNGTLIWLPRSRNSMPYGLFLVGISQLIGLWSMPTDLELEML